MKPTVKKSKKGSADTLNSEPASTRIVKMKRKLNKKLIKSPKKSDDLSSMNLDDFMTEVFNETDDSESDDENESHQNGNGHSFLDIEAEEGETDEEDVEMNQSDEEEYNHTINTDSFVDDEAVEDNTFPGANDQGGSDEDAEDEAEDDDPDPDDEEYDKMDELSASNHKKSLQKLQKTDPEFYKYLEENDKKLLQFDVSDSDSDNEEDGEKFHKPDENMDLEIGSDESDFEDNSEVNVEGVISMKMVKEWQAQIQVDQSISTIADVVNAFHAALNRVTGNEESDCKYKIEGSAVFNGVVQLCVLELQPALKRFLKLPSGAASKNIQLHKCKKWNKIKSQLKTYLVDLLKLMSGVSSAHIISVLLKHLHQMTPFVCCFPNIIQKVLKQLIQVWGSGEDTTRIVAFLCIIRLTTSQTSLMDACLKQMYLTYVSNAKFTSVNTLPAINFMRRSLVEIYCLNEASAISYHHVFLYIRQLAIHLRNAITLQKKESVQAVLNWQFVHSLHLWADLLSLNKTTLEPLVFPLVQVIIGTIKLIPTAQYFPLRFHCTQMLIDLGILSKTYIPILPLLLEVLNAYNFNRAHKKVSMKPMDLTCVLRVTKVEQTENGFKDALVEMIYQQMLQYLASQAHTIGYPDLTIHVILQVKKFLKICKVSNYCKKFRSLVDKLEENVRFINKMRKGCVLVLSDQKAIDAWETNTLLQGPPLTKFYASFKAVNKQMVAKRATDTDKLSDYKIPTIKKSKIKTDNDDDGPAVLFPSDSEDDDDQDDEDDDKDDCRVTEQTSKKTHLPMPLQHQAVKEEVEEEEEEDEDDLVEDLVLENF